MPPKKGKKESEKEKQAEEERLRLLEEERIAREKEQKEREIAEAKNQAAIEELLRNDAERLEAETDEIQKLTDSKSTELAIQMDKITKEIEWSKYLECSYLPNAKIEREVRSYLSSWSEEKLDTSDCAQMLDCLIKQFPNADSLSSQLQYERGCQEDLNNIEKSKAVLDIIIRLREILFAKCDYATAVVLQNMDLYNIETSENFMAYKITPNHTIGIWGNLTKNPRYKSIDIMDGVVSMSIPKPLSLANVGVRILLENGSEASAEFEEQETERHMTVVGGVLYLDLVELPELAKTVDKWTIRPILSPNYQLKRLAYPFKKPATETTEEKEENDGNSDLFQWTSLIHYPLPKGCLVDTKSAKVMTWNAEKKAWDDENITETDYDAETNRIKFRSTHFSPTALVQNTYGEFPLQEWSIIPQGPNRAVFTLKGSVSEISLEIGEGKVRLLSPKIDTIKDLSGQSWLPPSYLFKRLSQYGYNFKAPKSLKGVDIDNWVLKNPKVEEACSRGISLCSPCFQFKSSPSNRILASSKCAFQFKEITSTASPDENEGWKSLIFDSDFNVGGDHRRGLGFIAPPGPISDSTKPIVNGPEPTTIRASVYHLLRFAVTSEENDSRLETYSALYTETLYQVLNQTRALCFC